MSEALVPELLNTVDAICFEYYTLLYKQSLNDQLKDINSAKSLKDITDTLNNLSILTSRHTQLRELAKHVVSLDNSSQDTNLLMLKSELFDMLYTIKQKSTASIDENRSEADRLRNRVNELESENTRLSSEVNIKNTIIKDLRKTLADNIDRCSPFSKFRY